MNGLTLRHLRYLVAVAEHGQFSRAADACAVSQPALSQQIKELEALIGAQLFERSARHFALTPLGEQAVMRARKILAEVQDFGDFVRAEQLEIAGPLRMGIIPTIAPYLLPRVIGLLAGQYPSLRVRPREAQTTQLIADLINLDLDLALVALPIDEDALYEEPLFEEEFVLVRHAAEAAHRVPAPHSLKKMQLLLLQEGHCFRDQAVAFCDFDKGRVDTFMEASSLSTLVQMVGAGLGITVIPEMALNLETRQQNVAVARFARPAPTRKVGLIWRKNNPLGDKLKAISATLKDGFATDPETEMQDAGQYAADASARPSADVRKL